jgi:hypothetical protein
MKNIRNDYCIRMFTGYDEYRPTLSKINLQDGYLYATDASIAIKIKADLCVHNYTPVEKYPNVETIISNHKSFETKTINVDSIFHELIKIEVCFKPKTIDCDECGGNGVCSCNHCGSDYDCDKCGGTGKIASKELVLSGENDCYLFNKKYKLKYLDLIIRTAIFTGVKDIVISNSENDSGTIFTVGCFTILLMTLYDNK